MANEALSHDQYSGILDFMDQATIIAFPISPVWMTRYLKYTTNVVYDIENIIVSGEPANMRVCFDALIA